jgi:hypothetical protein
MRIMSKAVCGSHEERRNSARIKLEHDAEVAATARRIKTERDAAAAKVLVKHEEEIAAIVLNYEA